MPEISTRDAAHALVPFADGYVLMTDHELLDLGPALEVRERATIDRGPRLGLTLAVLGDRLVFGYRRQAEEQGRVDRAYVAGLPTRRRVGPR